MNVKYDMLCGPINVFHYEKYIALANGYLHLQYIYVNCLAIMYTDILPQ